MLERTIQLDRLAGQYLNFDKLSGLSTMVQGMKKLKLLNVEHKPLLIVKDAKALGALATTAMTPGNFNLNKRGDSALNSVRKLNISLLSFQRTCSLVQK